LANEVIGSVWNDDSDSNHRSKMMLELFTRLGGVKEDSKQYLRLQKNFEGLDGVLGDIEYNDSSFSSVDELRQSIYKMMFVFYMDSIRNQGSLDPKKYYQDHMEKEIFKSLRYKDLKTGAKRKIKGYMMIILSILAIMAAAIFAHPITFGAGLIALFHSLVSAFTSSAVVEGSASAGFVGFFAGIKGVISNGADRKVQRKAERAIKHVGNMAEKNVEDDNEDGNSPEL